MFFLEHSLDKIFVTLMHLSLASPWGRTLGKQGDGLVSLPLGRGKTMERGV